MNWYKIIKESQFVGADATMTPSNLADTLQMKMDMSDTQGIDGSSLNALGLESDANKFGIEVSVCGAEPGSNGGCSLPLSEYGSWHNYSMIINGERYRAYKCKHCKHALQPFNIQYSKHPKKKTRIKKKVKNLRRLGERLTLRVAQGKPGSLSGGNYNNPANAPYGRTDFSMDARVIPWKTIDSNYDNVYDSAEQKGKSKDKIIKVKNNGKSKYIRVRYLDGVDGVMPSNTNRNKGLFRQQPRYNPANGKNKGDGHGSWPHNRDWGKGGYQIDKPEELDGDWRTRFQTWSDYIKERNTNILTLVKPM